MRYLILAALAAFAAAFFLPYVPVSSSSDQPERDSLLVNGSFEGGEASPWEGLTPHGLVESPVQDGQLAARVTGEEVIQSGIPVVPGRQYQLSAWFRWEEFQGQDWGYDRISVLNEDWSEAGAVINLHRKYSRGEWHKVAITFTAQSDTVRVAFGMYGPQEKVELYFDDFVLVEKEANLPPSARISASHTRGEAPLTVQFTAESSDPDGAAALHEWDFGDGSRSEEPSVEHTFTSAGAHTVRLIVRDNDGEAAIARRTIFVTDDRAPRIEVNSTRLHRNGADQLVATLSGSLYAQGGAEIRSLVWDHITLETGGIIRMRAGSRVDWTSPPIPLKYGRNEILLTAADSQAHVVTRRMVINRPLSSPRVTGIQVSGSEVGLYERYEVNFDLDTVADNLFYRYDVNPPLGVVPGTGVTVMGMIETPSGETLEHPAFYEVEARPVACGRSRCFQRTGNSGWTLRFAPQEVGEHQVQIRAQDASGTTTVSVGSFIAVPSASKGFIRVSSDDSRYFEYSNGELYWPIGPAHGSNYAAYASSGQNIERPWMAGRGAYSTNFARWISSGKEMGNEGFDSNLNFNERYPRHELSQMLAYPDASRFWIGWSSGQDYRPLLTPGEEYQILLRLKTTNISGPVDEEYPHGLVLKTHGWPSEGFEESMRDHPSLITPVAYNAGWHTVISRYTAGERDASDGGTIYMSLYLDNVSSGEVYIDYFSIRPVLPNGELGPERMVNPSANLHSYVEPGPAAYFDWQVKQGERHGISFKYVVHDKRDWVQNHLNSYGSFVGDGDGYYQPEGTKARWLLEQWWRYLIARWGYSTAIHSWELNNEGPPDSRAHYQMAQEFAAFMRAHDTHPHLATTSFWSGWVPALWTDRERYPDVDYANIHEYITDPEVAYDVVEWITSSSDLVYQSELSGPVMFGENGLGGPNSAVFQSLAQSNPGIWYHNMVWAQLSAQPIYTPNYWWSRHLQQFDRRKTSFAFLAFVEGLDLNRGGYEATDAQVDNPALRVLGQKNMEKDRAYMWVQNAAHTWRNVMGIDSAQPIVPQSGAIAVRMNAGQRYSIEFWDTYTGTVIRTDDVAAGEDGVVVIQIADLESDLAVKILPDER